MKENPSYEVVFQDEVHFQREATITATWAKKGSAPQVKSYPGKQKVSYCGFVVPSTGEFFFAKPNRFTYETTIESIREFLKAHPLSQGRKYVIVMDNASWHKKAKRLIEDETEEKYADIRAQVIFLKLPAYALDLNPIEEVWRTTRKENTHNKFFRSIADLDKVVSDAFTEWSKPNKKLRQLCTFK